VRSRPELSYTELEFDTATAAGLPRLVFLVREDSRALPPASQPAEHRVRQAAFRRRLQESGVTTVWVATPADLEIGLYQALVELRGAAATPPSRPSVPAPGPCCAACGRPRRARFPRPRLIPRRLQPLRALALAALLSVLGAAIVPRLTGAGSQPLLQTGLGSVAFVGSQAQPAAEARAMTADVLKGFDLNVRFNSQQTAAEDSRTILQGQASGVSKIDLTDMTHSDLLALQANDALMDLTSLLQRLQHTRTFPPALLKLGRFGTNKQYYIPWLQATYMIVVNKQALAYLPRGVDPYRLTYDQLIAWGENIEQATGRPMIGLPADLSGPKGGMVYRFLQGYLYPSYTGTTLTDFSTPDAIQMWQMLKRLWAVANPLSSTYTSMQQPLLEDQVWIAWDHQARLAGALGQDSDRFIAIPAPSGPKGLGYMTAVVGLAIPKGARNPAGAEALIDWLTRPTQQAEASSSLSFFPVVQQAPRLAGPQEEEHAVDTRYRSATNGIETTLPAGLGVQTDRFTKVYQDTFSRIVVHDEDIQTVLGQERPDLQHIVNEAGAPCWLPDRLGTGPCQIR
jgi:multiple sugar transport system substrate-binding protein